jgi:hypothetical protein
MLGKQHVTRDKPPDPHKLCPYYSTIDSDYTMRGLKVVDLVIPSRLWQFAHNILPILKICQLANIGRRVERQPT